LVTQPLNTAPQALRQMTSEDMLLKFHEQSIVVVEACSGTALLQYAIEAVPHMLLKNKISPQIFLILRQ
jgi:hypothetical protein